MPNEMGEAAGGAGVSPHYSSSSAPEGDVGMLLNPLFSCFPSAGKRNQCFIPKSPRL